MTASARFRAIGVDCQVVATHDIALASACRLAESRLARLGAVASRFRSDSEVVRLARLGAPAGSRTVTAPASRLLLSLVDDALWAADVTGGLVDPTLGRAMESIGYDADLAEVLARPVRDGSPSRVAEAPRSTLGDVRIDLMACTITIAAGSLIDLGATAKASMADRIARELARHSGGGFLVDLGGDIAVAGQPPPGGWVISTDDDDSTAHRIGITTQGVATSGTDRRRWHVDGTLRHHLLDPVTCQPVSRTWRRVTCVGATALEANTASTAACVLADAAVDWLTERGIPARLVPERGAVVCTTGWPGARRECMS